MLSHTGSLGEHALGRFTEPDRDDALALGQAFPGAQVERDAGPSPVVDTALQCDERLGLRFGRDARLIAVADVLPAHHVVRVQRFHRPEDLVLLLADRAGRQLGGWFHRHEREDLEQVRDDHVAEGAGRFVVPGTTLQRQLLRDVDLDVIDEIAVPDRFEETVREPEREDVLGRLLAQEVVDPEDLLLGEPAVDRRVEFLRTRQVGPERLLHDHPRALHETGLVQHLENSHRRLRRNAEIVQYPRRAADGVRGALDRFGKGGRSVTLRDVGQRVEELVDNLRGQTSAGELETRLPGRGPGSRRW